MKCSRSAVQVVGNRRKETQITWIVREEEISDL
jgi:hypothetical protein